MDKLSLDRERRRRERTGKLNARRAATAKRVRQAARDKQAPEVSCTYVLKLADGNYKIGGTQRLSQRLIDHRRGKKLPPFDLFCFIPSNAPLWAERYLHGIFRRYGVRREIYALPDDALAWLKSLPRLDRDNEPTPPTFSAPLLPFVEPPPPRKVKARQKAPAPQESPIPPLPVHQVKLSGNWKRGRIRTVWHP